MVDVVSRRGGRAAGKNDVYIGRPSKWGNPFIEPRDGDREEVVERFRVWAMNMGWSDEELLELSGKTLVCWCKPLLCHGDVLAMMVKQAEDVG